jgi:hypothetical protein
MVVAPSLAEMLLLTLRLQPRTPRHVPIQGPLPPNGTTNMQAPHLPCPLQHLYPQHLPLLWRLPPPAWYTNQAAYHIGAYPYALMPVFWPYQPYQSYYPSTQ